MSKRQAKNIYIIIEPALRKNKDGKFSTLYGYKTLEGLIETITSAGEMKGKFVI